MLARWLLLAAPALAVLAAVVVPRHWVAFLILYLFSWALHAFAFCFCEGRALRAVRPIFGAAVLLHLPVQTQRVRTVGRTRFADAGLYAETRIPEERLAEYFSEGMTMLRGVLDPELLDALREELLPLSRQWHSVPAKDQTRGMRGVFMLSDSALDFALRGNLGALAAQLFGSPNTQTAGEPPGVHLWAMHLHTGYDVPAHHDDAECEAIYAGVDFPPNFTRQNRPRFYIPLVDDVRAADVVNQSEYARWLGPAAAKAYQRGNLSTEAFRREGTWQLPWIKGSHMNRGDVQIMATCSRHRGPSFRRRAVDPERYMLVLTLAAASSSIHPGTFHGLEIGDCHHGTWGELVSLSPRCHPRAHPRVEQLSADNQLSFSMITQPLWLVRHILEAYTPIRCDPRDFHCTLRLWGDEAP